MGFDRTSQKIAFTEALARHGNVRRAMRECGLASPTTAYEWLRQYRAHGAEWMRRPARKTRAVSTEIADQVRDLSERNPDWGKEKLAGALAGRYGRSVVSPAGVRSVMVESGLWRPPDLAPGPATGEPIDEDRLLEQVRRAIQRDLFGEPKAAAAILEAQVWRPLFDDPDRFRPLLWEPELGSWLQRGVLQLGHALIDSGRWRSALVRLTWFDDWLNSDDSLPAARQRRYQEQGRWHIAKGGSEWLLAGHDLALASNEPMESVSLRQADIWLETQQYLALLLRDKAGSAPIERLDAASRMIDAEMPWYVTPWKRAHYQGVIVHDLAVAQVQRGWSGPMVLSNLQQAAELLFEAGNLGMTASAWSNMARAHLLSARRETHRARRHHDRAMLASARALDIVTREQSPVLRANIWTDVTVAAFAMGSAQDDDRARIRAVAELAIGHELARRARGLLDNATLRPLLADYEDDLTRVAQG